MGGKIFKEQRKTSSDPYLHLILNETEAQESSVIFPKLHKKIREIGFLG